MRAMLWERRCVEGRRRPGPRRKKKQRRRQAAGGGGDGDGGVGGREGGGGLLQGWGACTQHARRPPRGSAVARRGLRHGRSSTLAAALSAGGRLRPRLRRQGTRQPHWPRAPRPRVPLPRSPGAGPCDAACVMCRVTRGRPPAVRRPSRSESRSWGQWWADRVAARVGAPRKALAAPSSVCRFPVPCGRTPHDGPRPSLRSVRRQSSQCSHAGKRVCCCSAAQSSRSQVGNRDR